MYERSKIKRPLQLGMLLANKTLTTGMWSKVGRVRNAAVSSALFTVLGLLTPEWVGAQQLLDDFNRANSTTVGGVWTEGGTNSGADITSNQLRLVNPVAVAGREWTSTDVSGVYNTTLSSNSCTLTWAFNMRFSRTTPSGLDAGNYGAAVMLAGTAADPSTGNGYAIVIGNSGAPDPVRLVRYTGGLSANANTGLIVSSPITDAQYLGVRVTYVPSTNTWQLFVTNNAGPFTSPLVGGTASATAVNSVHTGVNLPYTGAIYNHAAAITDNVVIDNYYVPQACIPTINFNTATALIAEPTASTTVNLTVFPASVLGGTVVVSMGLGAGVAYTTDFTVSGGNVTSILGTDITLTMAPGATSASFNIVLVDDALDEGNENITFTLSSTPTGDILLGTALVHSFTIVDNDGPPSVSFTTTLSTVLEGATGTFNISISPTVLVATTVQIQITNGPGAVYGTPFSGTQDYYTIPGAAASIITVTIPANTATASFTAPTFYPDVGVDTPTPGIETVTFTIISASGAAVVAAAPQNTARLNISDRDALPMVLTPGDLVIVGINTNNGACSGNVTEDLVSFFCFKPITTGTKLILTDNGYARCSAGTWGNNEGTVEMTRTGVTIPPGQVITFRIQGTSGASNVSGISPDAGWTCASLNGFTSLDLNSAGDQLFFMQGGTWTTNTPGSHNATYTGTPLYGFSTTGVWAIPPVASCASSANNSLSGLPIGTQCFSMAPTSSTQFNKLSFANILTTPLTQRNWMIAADATANWIAPPSCGSYNGAAPNWLLAPTLMITPGGFTPGLWRGTTSSDWFDCKNWDDLEVPLATTAVRIDETAASNCIIGVTAGQSAVCTSLLQTSSGTARNLTIQNNCGLTVGAAITVERTVAGTAVAFTVANGALPNTLTATNLTVQGPAATQAFFRNDGSLNLVTITGNLTIGTGGVVDISATPTTGGTIYVGGDYTNQGPTEATLDEAGGSIIFNGTAAQSISTASFQEVFYNLGVDKTTNNLTLNNPVAVRNVLGLTSGLLNTSATSLLTMRAGSSWTNATDASFVNGPMSKLGNTDFSFPIGKNNVLRPAGVRSLPVWPSLNFTAEYFPSTSYAWGIARESTLDHLSDCEHWLIDENVMASGTLNAIVELTWRAPYSCGVDNLSELRVARWDNAATPAPGIWRDRGNGGATGTFAAGTIPTAAGQDFITGFNTNDITAWTLASTTANNPLPVTLVEFTAKPEGSSVRLNWSTASEFENALFTVERSQYGVDFEHVLDVPGSMFSNVLLNYTELDRDPYGGLSYYRLRQTDVDGNFSYSPAVPVLFGGLSDRPLIVFGNSETITAVHGFPSGSRYALLDMTGRVIAEGSTTMDGRTELNGSNLSRGAYVVRLVHGDRSESARFVY